MHRSATHRQLSLSIDVTNLPEKKRNVLESQLVLERKCNRGYS